jgi:quercetin dioxygenase-like cupin family protein
MTFIDTSKLPAIERLPGWRGRYFDSANMTFGHYEFDAGASIHEHSHPQEEVWEILEGELEITIAGVTERAGPGSVGIVPPDALHAVRALSAGRAIAIDYPLRERVSRPATRDQGVDSGDKP